MDTEQDIPQVEPLSITQGSTVKWKKTLSHYKANNGWILTYAVRGATILDITAIADVADHAITLSTTITDALKTGIYWWHSYATKSSERFDVEKGTFDVIANFAAQAGGTYDGRSHAKKVLDAIEATLEDRATTADQEIQINGRSVKYWQPGDLLGFRDRYKAEYAKELNTERIKKGLKSSNNVYIRFVNA